MANPRYYTLETAGKYRFVSNKGTYYLAYRV